MTKLGSCANNKNEKKNGELITPEIQNHKMTRYKTYPITDHEKKMVKER